MFATLSAEARIQAGLNDLAANDLTTGRLAEYTGNVVSQTRLSLALSGTKALENSHGTLALETLAELRDLVRSAHPYPITLRNVTLVKKLLADRRRLQQRTSEPRLFSVCIDGRWFTKRDSLLGSIGLTIGIIQAAAMNAATADLLLAALNNSGIDASVHQNPFCGSDTVGLSFESLWGLPQPEEKEKEIAAVVETNTEESEAQ
jgi:hypothetical protein